MSIYTELKDRHCQSGSKNEHWSICYLQETHFKYKGWWKTYHTNTNQKKVGVDILISDIEDLRPSTVTSDNEGHYIIRKGSTLQ